MTAGPRHPEPALRPGRGAASWARPGPIREGRGRPPATRSGAGGGTTPPLKGGGERGGWPLGGGRGRPPRRAEPQRERSVTWASTGSGASYAPLTPQKRKKPQPTEKGESSAVRNFMSSSRMSQPGLPFVPSYPTPARRPPVALSATLRAGKVKTN